MSPQRLLLLGLFSSLFVMPAALPAQDKVATAVYAKVGNGYKRDKAKDGSFKVEHYALSNGGRIEGTLIDRTIERVTYPEVADIAMKLLAEQNYRYAQTKEQAKLLLVLNWGGTIAPNGLNKDHNVKASATALQTLQTDQLSLQTAIDRIDSELGPPSYPGETLVANTTAGFGPGVQSTRATNDVMAVVNASAAVESRLESSLTDDRVRDRLNELNARVLGYRDELAGANGIQRYAGGGDRYSDLLADIEESRYYIVVSAYDFAELTKHNKRKLLWQTRVSVRSPGNSFDATLAAMLKSASKYFGQDSGRLVRGEETKGIVEMKDLKFLGEAKEVKPAVQPAKATGPAAEPKK